MTNKQIINKIGLAITLIERFPRLDLVSPALLARMSWQRVYKKVNYTN